MTDTLSSIADRQLTPKRIVISFIVNAIINTIIAIILFAISFGKDFVATLVFSQCIGMSIYFANLAAVMAQFILAPGNLVALIKQPVSIAMLLLVLGFPMLLGYGLASFFGKIVEENS